MMCEVCGKDENVGVYASNIGPVSLAYCNDCLNNDAEASWVVKFLYDQVGGEYGTTDFFIRLTPLTTWYNGQYISIRKFFDILNNEEVK